MKASVDCPYCEGVAILKKQIKEIAYRKENFKVFEHFYQCEKCNEDFTTTETDTITLNQVHNQYREKHNIPFPEEIVAIKELYELSATKMSEVLSLGVNSYSNYEKGEMPSPAIAKLIKTAEKPEIFLGYLEQAKDYFSEASFQKVKKKVHSLVEEINQRELVATSLNIYNETNSFTGYRKINPDKIANLITYFISKSNPDYNSRLKLNKQLFYCDFRHYKNYGKSISGLSYRAVKYGPVPAKFDNIFSYMENEQLITPNWRKVVNGNAVEVFTTSAEFDSVLFSVDELDTIESIGDQFKNISSWDIVELSHSERAWKELESEKKLISYQEFAFDLNAA